MLKIQPPTGSATRTAARTSSPTSKVTFSLGLDQAPGNLSVLGDFNDWDPLAHPLKKRSNGTRSVTVELPAGEYHFKYLADDGAWFCDPDVADMGSNEYDEINSVFSI